MLDRLKSLRLRSKLRSAGNIDNEGNATNDVTPFDEPVVDDVKEDVSRLLDYLESHSSPSPQLVAHIIDFHRSGSTRCGGTLLDLGCGGGIMTKALSSYFQRTFARDPDPSMIKMCRLLQPTQDSGKSRWDIARGSSTNLNVPDQSIDCIVASSCAHLWNWSACKRLYATLASALKPGGSLIITGSRPLAGPYLSNDTERVASNASATGSSHLSQLVKDLPEELQPYMESARYQSGFADLYEQLPFPANNPRWDLSSKVYRRWISTAQEKQCLEASCLDWTLVEIISWLRSLKPYEAYAQRRDPSKMQIDMALNRDLAARVVREACEKDGVPFSLGVRVEMHRYEAIWAIKRSSKD